MGTLGDRRATAEIIRRYQFDFRKKFGQNFLVDDSILDKIIEAADITRDDCVLEIGPGIGTMIGRGGQGHCRGDRQKSYADP